MKTFSKCIPQGSKFNRVLTSWFGRPVHMAIECTFINKVREFSDGVEFFNLILNADTYKGDHTPRIVFVLTILNVNIIEFGLYNINHDNWTYDDIDTVEAPYKVD